MKLKISCFISQYQPLESALESIAQEIIFFQVQCLPLASLLLALDNPTVNYLSLDLEGAELEVLCC